jgi:hypothetical protein
MRSSNEESPKKEKPRTLWIHCQIHQTSKEELTSILFKCIHEIEREGKIPADSFYEANIILFPKPDKYTTKK